MGLAVILGEYRAEAQASAAALLAAEVGVPNDVRIYFDVDIVLRNACAGAGVGADELTETWKPEKAELERTAWGMCLSDFAERLSKVHPAYGAFVKEKVFTDATYKREFKDIRAYLVKKVKAVLK